MENINDATVSVNVTDLSNIIDGMKTPVGRATAISTDEFKRLSEIKIRKAFGVKIVAATSSMREAQDAKNDAENTSRLGELSKTCFDPLKAEHAAIVKVEADKIEVERDTYDEVCAASKDQYNKEFVAAQTAHDERMEEAFKIVEKAKAGWRAFCGGYFGHGSDVSAYKFDNDNHNVYVTINQVKEDGKALALIEHSDFGNCKEMEIDIPDDYAAEFKRIKSAQNKFIDARNLLAELQMIRDKAIAEIGDEVEEGLIELHIAASEEDKAVSDKLNTRIDAFTKNLLGA